MLYYGQKLIIFKRRRSCMPCNVCRQFGPEIHSAVIRRAIYTECMQYVHIYAASTNGVQNRLEPRPLKSPLKNKRTKPKKCEEKAVEGRGSRRKQNSAITNGAKDANKAIVKCKWRT